MLTRSTVSGSSVLINDLMWLRSRPNTDFVSFSEGSLNLWKMTDLSVISVLTSCEVLFPKFSSSLYSDLASDIQVSLCLHTFLGVTVSQSLTLLCLLIASPAPLRLCFSIVSFALLCESTDKNVDPLISYLPVICFFTACFFFFCNHAYICMFVIRYVERDALHNQCDSSFHNLLYTSCVSPRPTLVYPLLHLSHFISSTTRKMHVGIPQLCFVFTIKMVRWAHRDNTKNLYKRKKTVLWNKYLVSSECGRHWTQKAKIYMLLSLKLQLK